MLICDYIKSKNVFICEIILMISKICVMKMLFFSFIFGVNLKITIIFPHIMYNLLQLLHCLFQKCLTNIRQKKRQLLYLIIWVLNIEIFPETRLFSEHFRTVTRPLHYGSPLGFSVYLHTASSISLPSPCRPIMRWSTQN